MLRSYPNFTTSRLDAIQPVPDKFSNVYAYTDTRSSAEKGESQTIGLWTFSTDGRESLHDVVLRYVYVSFHRSPLTRLYQIALIHQGKPSIS